MSYIECTLYPAKRENAYTAACYCRLSRDDENDGTSVSIETQRKVLEVYIGTDPNNADTDHDGLSDSFEISDTNTDPTKADTDDNGISDGAEDFDEDGLTNLEEFENNTDPYIADTDSDGLSDGDEVKTHGTDPLVADTDGDGLDDGDEIVLGTNPLVQDTDGDGIIDSKEKIQQTFTHKVKNKDCAVTEVIVDMECTGNINKTTAVESVMNTDILCTDVVGLVGEALRSKRNPYLKRLLLLSKLIRISSAKFHLTICSFCGIMRKKIGLMNLKPYLTQIMGQ